MNEPKKQLEVDLDSDSSADISWESRKVLFVILILPFSLNKKIKFPQLKLKVKRKKSSAGQMKKTYILQYIVTTY